MQNMYNLIILLVLLNIGILTLQVIMLISYRNLLVQQSKAISKSEEPTEAESEPEEEDSIEELERQLQEAATGNLVSDQDISDDSAYESLIAHQLQELGGSVYYANYTKSSVEISGQEIPGIRGALKIVSSQQVSSGLGETKVLEDWDDRYDTNIRYVFRVSIGGQNYLIWGTSREEAYLNLSRLISMR